MQLSNSKILITGGGSGIGLALAERFAEMGNTVIVSGRRADVLAKAEESHPNIIAKVCDLSLEAERTALFNWVTENHPDLDTFINNAGIQNWMGLDDENYLARAEAEITTNVIAPIHLTQLFSNLPGLKTLVNVTSGLAFVPASPIAVYSATKAFFHSYTLSTRYILNKKGIEVIELIPPALNTDLGGVGIHNNFPPVSGFVDHVIEGLKEGKDEIAYLHAVDMSTGGPEVLKARFKALNP